MLDRSSRPLSLVDNAWSFLRTVNSSRPNADLPTASGLFLQMAKRIVTTRTLRVSDNSFNIREIRITNVEGATPDVSEHEARGEELQVPTRFNSYSSNVLVANIKYLGPHGANLVITRVGGGDRFVDFVFKAVFHRVLRRCRAASTLCRVEGFRSLQGPP